MGRAGGSPMATRHVEKRLRLRRGKAGRGQGETALVAGGRGPMPSPTPGPVSVQPLAVSRDQAATVGGRISTGVSARTAGPGRAERRGGKGYVPSEILAGRGREGRGGPACHISHPTPCSPVTVAVPNLTPVVVGLTPMTVPGLVGPAVAAERYGVCPECGRPVSMPHTAACRRGRLR